MVFLVIVMTINGQDSMRREPMLDAPTCFARALERYHEIEKAHPEATGFGVGCALMTDDRPA